MARRKPAPKPKKKRPPPTAESKLTASEGRFVGEYIIDDNATRAYKVAFPAAAYTTCRTNGSLLLAKPNVAAAVEAARLARQERTEMRADTALIEAGRLAYSDPLYLFEDDGATPRNIRDIPPDTRRAIASVKVLKERRERDDRGCDVTCPHCESEHHVPGDMTTVYQTIEYKLWPKPVGLDKVFKHLGLAQEIAPLDVLLAALSPELAAQVRAALAGSSSGEK